MPEANPRPTLGTEALFADRVIVLHASSESRLTPLDKQTNASGWRRTAASTVPVPASPRRPNPSRGPFASTFADTRGTTAASSQTREKLVFMRVLARKKNEKKVN